jgi:aminoglycoside/choline kinase family phosphotransferase
MAGERERQRRDFLFEQGLDAATIEPLQPDASFRRYFRIRQAGEGWMLMDAPPERENARVFVTVARHLKRLGLRPPSVLAVDPVHGFVLLEDLGDDTYTRLLARGEAEAGLYSLAIDVLRHLHAHPEARASELPVYNEQRLLDEAVILVDWYWPAVHGEPAARSVREAYLDAWRDILRALPASPQTLVLRDFHVDNLMRVPGPSGVLQCGLLDFQDALIGPPAYDVVSLLEDARRDLAPGLAEIMLARYLDGWSTQKRETFMHWYTVLGAQRHCKVVGIFVRLCRRDGKCHYLAHVPRVLRLLESHLHQPRLAPLDDWLERYLPGLPSYRESRSPRP